MNLKPWTWRRPQRHRTEILSWEDDLANVAAHSWMEPIPWLEKWDQEGVIGISFLGLVLQIGDTFGNTYPTIALNTRRSKSGLTVLEIRLPSLLRKCHMGTQWGAVPHTYRPLRETVVSIRHGQTIPVWDDTTRKIVGERVAWGIDLQQCEQLFDAIKRFIIWRDRLYKHNTLRSGDYKLGFKLIYRRRNNDNHPHDEDMLYWGDRQLIWNLD